mmetsp:Transcript_391/g.592  ORF Transcript_391/g.592 Transcript_391/m.592 type:complete len:485 (-) Transcript_391:115-1569(-)
MGKRGNENSQMSKEDWEAQEANSSGESVGIGFDKASGEQLSKRRIIKVGRRFRGGGGGSAGAVATASQPSFAPPPSASINNNNATGGGAKNPFAGVGLVPSGGGGANISASNNGGGAKNPFASVSFVSNAAATPTTNFSFGQGTGTTTTKIQPTTTATSITQKTKISSSNKRQKKPRFRKDVRVNRALLNKIRQEKDYNPLCDWSDWVKEYLDYVDKVQEELQPLCSSTAAAKNETTATSMIMSPVPPSAPAAKVTATAPAPFSFGAKTAQAASSAAAPSAPSQPKPFAGFSFAQPAAATASIEPVKASSLFPPVSSTTANGTGTATSPSAGVSNAMLKANTAAATTATAVGETTNATSSSNSELMQETNTEENCLHETRAKYYKILKKTGSWKAYSSGVLRLYRHKENTNKRRMVLRNEAGRVQLNLGITDGMMFQKELNKKRAFIKFVAVQDQSKGVEKFMLQVKPDGLDVLYGALEDLAKP